MSVRVALLASSIVACCSAPLALAALPTYDKIVVVIEENHTLQAVLGSGEAPYLDSLAAGGASFTNMFALTHPSQPNYLHLFSGDNQGVTDNFLAVGPFSTPNLSSALTLAGKSFVGYSESMPAAGYTGVAAEGGLYARRHNPWVNWQADPPGLNQLPPSVNQPLTAFPSDFAQLPNVSFVVPNNQHNGHDGTLQEMDAWLLHNLGAYADWAAVHNSLLIVTWDEDDYLSENRIPTVFYGAQVPAGKTVRSTWTLHNLLRTLSDLTGSTPPSRGADVQPLVSAFAGAPSSRTIAFRQGIPGYAETEDTVLDPLEANVDHAMAATLGVAGDGATQSLLKFGGLFGSGVQLVPAGADILSAKLLVFTTTAGASASLHQMLMPWSDTATWDSVIAGVSTDGVEALATAEFELRPDVVGSPAIFDVTASVQAWADGAANHGWLFKSTAVSAWQFSSSEHESGAVRPLLEITYAVDGSPADFNNDGAVDAADLDAWSGGFGVDGGADADFDHDVDGHDFLLWQRQLTGGQPALESTTGVPEPPQVVLAFAILAVGAAGRTHIGARAYPCRR